MTNRTPEPPPATAPTDRHADATTTLIRRPSQRPSAALVLGVLSGCVAAIAVLPTAIPLTGRLAVAEETLALRHAGNAAYLAVGLLERDQELHQGTMDRLGLGHLHVVSEDGLLVYQEGPDLPETAEILCTPPVQARTVPAADGTQWAVACIPHEGMQVVAAWAPNYGSRTQVFYLVITLAAIVGIVTALGVLRLLSPLSYLARAIVRVGAGERGVRLSPTWGLEELDQLIERVNAAARSMEDREDAILSRIKAVQEMARMVAHEVRNPLQSLELLTSLIASEQNPEERHELAKAIHTEIRALDMVVTRVLREGASRGALHLPLHRATQSIRDVVDQVVALRHPEAKAHGIMLERGPIADVSGTFDAALIGRSIENLVLNALQAVPPNGGRVRISATADDDKLRILVEDNGPGVDPALADHIFEPNVTGRTGGTGLGLALVKEVVEAHGGTISQDKSMLGGARFTVTIPLEAAGGAQAPAQGTGRR